MRLACRKNPIVTRPRIAVRQWHALVEIRQRVEWSDTKRVSVRRWPSRSGAILTSILQLIINTHVDDIIYRLTLQIALGRRVCDLTPQ